MTAADRREELEAVIHRQLTRAWKYGLDPGSPGDARTPPAGAILAAADAYAHEAAGERIARMTSDQLARLAEIRRRGEQATAEATARRTP